MKLLELIPGLPNDIALECLIRAPIDQFSKVASICKGWKSEIEKPLFSQWRKMANLTSTIVVMVQATISAITDREKLARVSSTPVYKLTICDPGKNSWNELPPIPGFPNGLPMFCQVVGVGLDVVVIGGCDPTSWKVLDSVYIFNFVSGGWRRGADMPGGNRLFFGCASDLNHIVLVAGGHDNDKNALQSALTYDVTKNEWNKLPDMTRQRDECQCVYYRNKFHVIGGYETERQGRFERSAEIFDVSSWQWCQEEEFLMMNSNFSSVNCFNHCDEKLYMYQDDEVIALENETWKVVSKLPIEVCNVSYLATWDNKLLIICSERFGESYDVCYVLDLDNNSWNKLQVSEKYSGHVRGGCCLVI